MKDFKLSYSGIYKDGAKIKTGRTWGSQIDLTIRRDSESPEENYILTYSQAIELSYALLRALKQTNDDMEEVENEQT